MAITLDNTEVVLGTLELLVGCILHVAAGFAYLAIFGVNVSHLVISLSSMTLAFAFVFGNSLRTVYESVVFLFVVRPYKVGAHPFECLRHFICVLLAAAMLHKHSVRQLSSTPFNGVQATTSSTRASSTRSPALVSSGRSCIATTASMCLCAPVLFCDARALLTSPQIERSLL